MPTFQMLQLFSFFMKLVDLFLKKYYFSERVTLRIDLRVFEQLLVPQIESQCLHHSHTRLRAHQKKTLYRFVSF